MTPSLPDILTGLMIAVITPLPPEAGPDYLAGRAGMVATLARLASQEAERGIAARVWENAAIREVLGRTETDSDLSWSALDRVNAELRRELIAVHIAAEDGGDARRQGDILALYKAMAEARRLDLPAL